MSYFERDLLHELRRIARAVEHLTWNSVQVTAFTLGGVMINGVHVGTTGTFQIGLVPPNGVPLQSGPTITVDDSNVTLGAVDPKTLEFTAAVAAGDTATSFNVTVAGVNGAGAALSHVFNVPILAAPPVQVTDFTLSQIS